MALWCANLAIHRGSCSRPIRFSSHTASRVSRRTRHQFLAAPAQAVGPVSHTSACMDHRESTWSAYAPDYLAWLADALRQGSEAECWCLFDNTASGAALENAWDLHQLMHGGVRSSTASHLQ